MVNSIEHARIRTCVCILMCPMKLATRHKPNPYTNTLMIALSLSSTNISLAAHHLLRTPAAPPATMPLPTIFSAEGNIASVTDNTNTT